MTTWMERWVLQSLSSVPAFETYRYLPVQFLHICKTCKGSHFFPSKKSLQNPSQVYSGTFQISNTDFSGSLENQMTFLNWPFSEQRFPPGCWIDLENTPSWKPLTTPMSAPGNKPALVTTVADHPIVLSRNFPFSPVPPTPPSPPPPQSPIPAQLGPFCSDSTRPHPWVIPF